MGTRSITRVYDGEDEIACIYRQFDGYLAGHGHQVAKFLASRKFVNGIPGGDTNQYFNGMGCFAAALVWELKRGEYNKGGAGNVYLTRYGDGDHGQEYEYIIRGGSDRGAINDLVPIVVEVWSKYRQKNEDEPWFKGSIAEFVEFCDNPPEDKEE